MRHRIAGACAAALLPLLLAAVVSPAAGADAQATAEQRRVGQTAAGLYKRAEAKIEQQKFDEAAALLEKALARYPDSGVFVSGVLTEPYYPHYLMGVVHMEREQYAEAIEQFQLEQQQGQIQNDSERRESLNLRLARAKRTDDQAPVIQTASAEVIETILEGDREFADVRFRGVVVDSGGVGSLTVDGREIEFRQSDDGYAFDEIVRMDPVKPGVELVVSDITGNFSRQDIAVDLPPLDLGAAVSRVHALIVGVNRYTKEPGEPDLGSILRHQGDGGSGTPIGACPEDANPCGTPSLLHCYHLADLNAAAQDAERVHRFLLSRGVPPENVKLLVSNGESLEATYAAVRAALDDLSTREGDTVLFFFAGHGVNSKRQKNLMLLSDTEQWECGDTPKSARTSLEQTSIGVDDVEQALMKGRFQERYVILDACRTPRLASTRSIEEKKEQPAGFSSRGLRMVSSVPGDDTIGQKPVVFYATFDRSVSVEWNVRKAGYFTWFLLQGLRRDLSLWELKTFVQDSVQKRTRDDHGLTQKPHVVLPEALENDYALQKRTQILGGSQR